MPCLFRKMLAGLMSSGFVLSLGKSIQFDLSSHSEEWLVKCPDARS